MKSRERAKLRARVCLVSIAIPSVFAMLFVASSQQIAGSEDSFVPLICTADTTVGLHDAFVEGEATETYEPRVFLSSEFKLVVNLTFQEMLADENVDLYLTLQDVKTDVTFEYSCSNIKGRGERRGYSCVNSPPTEMLAIDPTSMRFSRASVGGWTFYTAEDLNDSAVLFVEKGTCVQASSEHKSDKPEKQSN